MLSTDPSFLISPSFGALALFAITFGGFIILSRTGALLPRHFRLQSKGLDLLLAGQPIQAEQCYRAALAMGSSVPQDDRIRLLVCLGDALLDQARYDEAKQCLAQALSLGDPTGSGQGSMADLLIEQGTDPQGALDIAEKAMELQAGPMNRHFGNRWSDVFSSFMEAKGWARQTQALVQLDKKSEARQAMDRSLRIAEAADVAAVQTNPQASLLARLILGDRLQNVKKLTITDVHWRIGLALLTMREPNKAAEHFRIARDNDPKGKYRRLAQQQLVRLGSWAV